MPRAGLQVLCCLCEDAGGIAGQAGGLRRRRPGRERSSALHRVDVRWGRPGGTGPRGLVLRRALWTVDVVEGARKPWWDKRVQPQPREACSWVSACPWPSGTAPFLLWVTELALGPPLFGSDAPPGDWFVRSETQLCLQPQRLLSFPTQLPGRPFPADLPNVTPFHASALDSQRETAAPPLPHPTLRNPLAPLSPCSPRLSLPGPSVPLSASLCASGS